MARSGWPVVLVINQFAMPRTQWGLTRNAELFSRVQGWDPVIVSASRDHYSQAVFTTTDPLFRLVDVPAYQGNGPKRMWGWVVFGARAARIGLMTKRLGLVFASSPHLLAPVAGYLVSLVRRVPLVVEIRDLWPESIVASGNLRRGSTIHRVLQWLERFLYHRAAQLVVVTQGWEEHFAALGVPADKVHVVPNGTEVADLPSATEREALRKQLGITGITAVYAGAHGPANGLGQVLDAAAKLPEVNFVLIGAGAEREALLDRSRREGLTNVEFRSPVPKSELVQLLAACDIGIHVLAPWDLLSQGLSPNKVFDYFAAGLPLVSNCADGLRAVVTDGEAGRLGSFSELGQCLADVAHASDEQRRAWGAAGREIVTTRYSRSSAAAQLTDILDAAARPRRRLSRPWTRRR